MYSNIYEHSSTKENSTSDKSIPLRHRREKVETQQHWKYVTRELPARPQRHNTFPEHNDYKDVKRSDSNTQPQNERGQATSFKI